MTVFTLDLHKLKLDKISASAEEVEAGVEEGGGHTFPFLAEKLLVLDGCRGRESVFFKDWWTTLQGRLHTQEYLGNTI